MAEKKFRAGVIGLGWMGMLYDVGSRMGTWHTDDVNRPTPDDSDLDIHRKFHHYQRHDSRLGIPVSYSMALHDRPEVELVAAADRDVNRLRICGERFGINKLYSDAKEMLQKEKLDILAISTNVKGRAELTVLAVEYGAKGIMTEKPMAYSLEETDQMVEVCKNAGVPLVCGSTSASHPSMASAKQLIQDGAIGEVLSYDISSNTNLSQHQNWSYFIDSPAAWVIATGDEEKRESGSAEFRGEGMLVTESGQVVHFRKGGPMMRVTGTEGEIYKRYAYTTWHLAKDIKRSSLSGVNLPENQSYKVDRVEVPWPLIQMDSGSCTTYGFADVFDCLAGKLDEPKNSGRRVAKALEVEFALKMSSAQGGVPIKLPLKDRSISMEYDWHR